MRKYFRTLLCTLLVCVLLLPAAFAEDSVSFADAWALAEQGITVGLQDLPLLPEDCSGYEMRITTRLADAVSALIPLGSAVSEENGLSSYALSEEDLRENLKNARILSKGPDGALFLVATELRLPFVLRGKMLTLLWQAENRGAPDEYGNLKNALDYRLHVQPDFLRGTVRWSPDGRYLFLNEPDAWAGVQLQQDDPYLWDTQTGEIFLLETGPKGDMEKDPFRNIMAGRFTRDGQYFDYLLYTDTLSSDTRGILMRYELETGTLKPLFESSNFMWDLCDMGEGRLLLLESGDERQLIRLSITKEGIFAEREPLQINYYTSDLFPVSEDMACLLVSYPGACSLLQPIRWEETGPWLKIQDLSSDRLTSLSPDEAQAQWTDAIHYLREGRTNVFIVAGSLPDFGNIHYLQAIAGTPFVFLETCLAHSITSNWPDREQIVSAWMLLNMETLQSRIIRQWPYSISSVLTNDNEILYGNSFAVWNGLASLCPASPESASSDSSEWDIHSPDGDYLGSMQGNDLVLTPVRIGISFVSLRYTNLDTTVTAAGDGYLIRSRFTRLPEPETRIYLVPEAITEERYKSFVSSMSSKNKKQIGSCYTLVKPDKLDKNANRDELLAAYPSLETEAMYILKSDIRKSNLEKLETIFAEAGYTLEDFELDAENVAVTTNANRATIYDKDAPAANQSIPTTFPDAASDPSLTPDRTLQLANLCDRINSAVYLQYLRPEGGPVPVLSLIPDTIDLSGTLWRISPDSVEDTDGTLTLALIVTPEN